MFDWVYLFLFLSSAPSAFVFVAPGVLAVTAPAAAPVALVLLMAPVAPRLDVARVWLIVRAAPATATAALAVLSFASPVGPATPSLEPVLMLHLMRLCHLMRLRCLLRLCRLLHLMRLLHWFCILSLRTRSEEREDAEV